MISDILLIFQLLKRICRAVLNLNIGTQKGRLWISHLKVAHSISWYILIDFRFQLYCSLYQWVCQIFPMKEVIAEVKCLSYNCKYPIFHAIYWIPLLCMVNDLSGIFLYAPRALNCTEILGNLKEHTYMILIFLTRAWVFKTQLHGNRR